MPADTQTPGRVRRACDGCRVRKVKCDGAQPCAQCQHHGVHCVSTLEPEKRKNPVRGRLVARARGEAAAAAATAAGPGSLDQLLSSSPGAVNPASITPSASISDSPGIAAPNFTPTPPQTADFLRSLLPAFEVLVYPFSPAVSPADMAATIDAMDENLEDAALAYAFGAATTFLTATSPTMHGDIASRVSDLLRCSLEAHKRVDLRLDDRGRLDEDWPVSVKRIMTCIYLEISMMPFKLFDRSFHFIREAITMIQTVQARRAGDAHAAVMRGADLRAFQRLYWEAYIHERFLTIASGFPSVLPPLPSGVPIPDPTAPPHVEAGFNRLIHLFLILDDTFLSHWDGRASGSNNGSNITVDWIEAKQVQLDQDEINAAEAEHELRRLGNGGLSELQHADLFITRLWMRTLLWQLALANGLLRSDPSRTTHEGLSLRFPALRLSTQLRSLVSRLDSIASISTQGSGILQKLFEITSTIADVLAVSSVHQGDLDTHIEDFLFVARFLMHFERVRDRQKAYLLEKIDVLRTSHPTVLFPDLPVPGGGGAGSQASTPMGL